MNYQLCKEFPALSPYDIEKKRFYDVIRLYADVRAMQIRNSKTSEQKETSTNSIRRPAGDDWF